jgi:hypothetical protein
VEAAGIAPASADHLPDACYERSRRSLISASGSVNPRGTSPDPHPPRVSPGDQGSCHRGGARYLRPRIRAAGRPARPPRYLGEGELVTTSRRVRTYWFPGGLTRPTRSPRLATSGRICSTSKLDRPRVVCGSNASEQAHTAEHELYRPLRARGALAGPTRGALGGADRPGPRWGRLHRRASAGWVGVGYEPSVYRTERQAPPVRIRRAAFYREQAHNLGQRHLRTPPYRGLTRAVP